MLFKINFYKIIFILFSITSLFFIDNDTDIIELLLKLGSILVLFFYYLSKTKEVDYLYILILLFSCLSSSLLIFPSSFILLGTIFLILNRLLYILITRKAMNTFDYKMFFMFLSIFFVPAIIIYPQLNFYLGKLTYPVLSIAILSVVMCTFAFVNYFTKMTTKNKFLAFGLLIFSLADVLTAYNQFIDYSFLYVVIYTIFYYLARYLVCEAMIVEKNFNR